MRSANCEFLLVSIVMGAYNCEQTISQAIESIIAQTYTNWEFIICDDGSKDGTLGIVESYAACDSRIIVIKNPKNLGLNLTLNRCVEVARGNYIARMDGDDISLPHRLERLVEATKDYPDLAIISSWMQSFNEKGDDVIIKAKLRPEKEDFAYGSPFSHPACIIKRSALISVNCYGTQEKFRRSQDYNLWFKLYAAGYQGMNIQEVLYKFRDDSAAIQRRNFRVRLNEASIMWTGFKQIGLSFWYYPMILKPLALGIMPIWLYRALRKCKSWLGT